LPRDLLKTVRPTSFILRGAISFGNEPLTISNGAIDSLNQALAKDPNYAPAYAGIADSYVLVSDTPMSLLRAVSEARSGRGKSPAIG